jgi:nucleotide-binding universal stress UspA family protein
MEDKRLLIAIDASEASTCAVRYVAHMIGARQDYRVCLLHVPASAPPHLLEHGGSEDPTQERQLQAALRNTQAAWAEKIDHAAQGVLDSAQAVLRHAQVPTQALTTQVVTPVPGQGLDTCILGAAQQHACGTIVVGRASFSWWQEVFKEHVADKLIAQSQGFTLWVVQ